ncbi:MAG: calcium/sodium antiporter [Gammaproteobacteria bacterium]|nr:calcium/sodium antiporter [Gammaproteobacteria bacterium]
MLTFIIALAVGFSLLMWSADQFVEHALQLDQHFHVSKYVIGIVVLGFGTSAPELFVSAISAWQGNPGLAIGNALGSNTTNILLVLGVTLCIFPLYINARVLRKDFLLLLGATALFTVLTLDHQLQLLDGVILIIVLLAMLYVLTTPEQNTTIQTEPKQVPTQKSLAAVLTGLALGLTILLLSSKLVVWGAISIAELLNINDLIIGLTVIALGTSLPELATCISSAMKKHSELAVGNIIGSNIFNTLGVTGIASLITTYSVPHELYERDIPIMWIATIMLFLLAWVFIRTKIIPRAFGILFIIAYLSYMYLLYQQSL